MKVRTALLTGVLLVGGGVVAMTQASSIDWRTHSGGPGDRRTVILLVEWDDHEDPDGDKGNGAAIVGYSGTANSLNGRDVPPGQTRTSPWRTTTTAKVGDTVRLNAYTKARNRFPHCVIVAEVNQKSDSAVPSTGGKASPGTCSAVLVVA